MPGWLPADLAVPESAGVACLACRLPPLPLALSLPPSPRPPSRREGGEIFSFLMQGASPLASPGLNPGGTGAGARITRWRAACPAGCRLTLPPLSPAGGVPSLLPVYPAFSLLCCPHPPAPLPGGKGEIFLFSYARGFAPCIPGAEPMVRRKTDRNRFPASGAVAHLYGRVCKCRKQSNAGVPGAKPPAK